MKKYTKKDFADVVARFKAEAEARFPIEAMRVTQPRIKQGEYGKQFKDIEYDKDVTYDLDTILSFLNGQKDLGANQIRFSWSESEWSDSLYISISAVRDETDAEWDFRLHNSQMNAVQGDINREWAKMEKENKDIDEYQRLQAKFGPK
jgi:hypothetical protein